MCDRSSFANNSRHDRKSFEDEALIYAPSAQGPSWHKVSQCVWSTATRLRGKPSLNDEYEQLYDFFVEFLRVKPVDLGMAVDELRQTGDEGASADVLRDSIWTVNSLLSVSAEWPDSNQVTRCRIFPVRLPSDEVHCLSADAEFFVVDREPYRVAFERHVKLLDFTLAEVAELDPFLRWAKLESRYLSNCVKEVTSFGGGDAVVVLDTQKQICNRAHALLRFVLSLQVDTMMLAICAHIELHQDRETIWKPTHEQQADSRDFLRAPSQHSDPWLRRYQLRHSAPTRWKDVHGKGKGERCVHT